MFNKFVIVLALLITLSMTTKLELKSNNECDYGTLSQRMNDSKIIHENHFCENLEGEVKIQSSFIKRIAQMAQSAPSNDKKITLLDEYNGIIEENALDKVREDEYFVARDKIVSANIKYSGFREYMNHLFAQYYIKSLINNRRPATSCLTTKEYVLLYVFK